MAGRFAVAVISQPYHFRPWVFAAVLALALNGIAPLARADDPAPKEPSATAAMTAQSKISAIVEFGLPALDRALEQQIPRRLATFEDRTTRCWHRRMFRREIDIDCAYSGFVERTGPISLRADKGRLSAAVPLFGTVAGQGIGRFARLLHGTADGQLTVYAAARPRLRPDWTVDLDMSEGFRWQEPPILRILGFSVNLSRFVEPRVREQLARVQADAASNLRKLDLRGKAETAWRQAFAAVKIVDTPEIWLQITPQTVAFAGMHAHGDVLEGALEITGTSATTIGTEPAANTPTPLPPLGADVSEPGRFEIVLPVNIDYDALRAKIQDVATAVNNAGTALRDIQVRPAADKIVIGLRLAGAETADKDGEWVYLTATPRLDAASQTIAFPDIALSTTEQSATTPPAAAFKGDDFLRGLREQFRIRYQAELDKVVASANAHLTRSLGNGFRSEAHLTSSGVANIQLLGNTMRVDFRAGGDLKILYGF